MFALIEDANSEGLIDYLRVNADVPLFEIVDDRGYTLLHEACFHNMEDICKALINLGKDTLTTQAL